MTRNEQRVRAIGRSGGLLLLRDGAPRNKPSVAQDGAAKHDRERPRGYELSRAPREDKKETDKTTCFFF